MFEDSTGHDEVEFDAVTICFWIEWIPFVVAWGHYNNASSEWASHAYCSTYLIYIYYPLKYEKPSVRKR